MSRVVVGILAQIAPSLLVATAAPAWGAGLAARLEAVAEIREDVAGGAVPSLAAAVGRRGEPWDRLTGSATSFSTPVTGFLRALSYWVELRRSHE